MTPSFPLLRSRKKSGQTREDESKPDVSNEGPLAFFHILDGCQEKNVFWRGRVTAHQACREL